MVYTCHNETQSIRGLAIMSGAVHWLNGVFIYVFFHIYLLIERPQFFCVLFI